MYDSSNPHIISSFDDDMDLLFKKLDSMGEHAIWSLKTTLESIKSVDMDLANSVVIEDYILDQLEIEVDNSVVRIIALRQPVARDLRELIVAIKIASCFERVGDLSKNIAKRLPVLMEGAGMSAMKRTLEMGDFVVKQLRDSLTAYNNRDIDLAMEVWKSDFSIDEFFNIVFRELTSDMSKDSHVVPIASQMLFLAKNLERIGDHTTFVAEMIHYVVGGEFMSESRPKEDLSWG